MSEIDVRRGRALNVVHSDVVYPDAISPDMPRGRLGWRGQQPRYAAWHLRLVSSAVDAVLVGLPGFVLISVGALIGRGSHGDLTPTGVACLLAGNLAMLAVWLWVMSQQGRTGQSPGKRVAGTVLVSQVDGRPIGFRRSVWRCIAHLADVAPYYIGCLWPLWDRRRQTFADKIAKTVVLKQEWR